VLGEYLEEAGVARHNNERVASDLIDLAFQSRDRDQPGSPQGRPAARSSTTNT
jgi:hypothetical protein